MAKNKRERMAKTLVEKGLIRTPADYLADFPTKIDLSTSPIEDSILLLAATIAQIIPYLRSVQPEVSENFRIRLDRISIAMKRRRAQEAALKHISDISRQKQLEEFYKKISALDGIRKAASRSPEVAKRKSRKRSGK